jgi:hypothetical protein
MLSSRHDQANAVPRRLKLAHPWQVSCESASAS